MNQGLVVSHGGSGTSGGELLEISMGIDHFASEWVHCDKISSYIARMVSHNRSDSLLYANLFSSALNELLETIFSNHGPKGDFTCRVSRHGAVDRVDLVLPCDDRALEFYSKAVSALESDNVEDIYHAALFATDGHDPRLGLLEVAVDYKAKFSLHPSDGQLVLSAEMSLEGVH